MAVKSYRDPRVWQDTMDLVEHTYRWTKSFPEHELYALTSQVRRAAVSIPSNIAEGHTRRHTREFLQFLAIAQASLAEVETQLQIAARLIIWSRRSASTLWEKRSRLGVSFPHYETHSR